MTVLDIIMVVLVYMYVLQRVYKHKNDKLDSL